MTNREMNGKGSSGAGPSLESIVRRLTDIVYLLDTRGNITFINDAVRRYGYAPEELLGKSILDLIHPDDRVIAAARVLERRAHRRDHTTCRVRFLTGLDVPMPGLPDPEGDGPLMQIDAEGIYEEFPPSDESFAGTQGVARDVTHSRRMQLERDKAEAQRWQARKLQALGQMACGMSAEFDKLLRVVDRDTDRLAESLAPGSEGLAWVEEIREASGNASRMVEQLRSFGRCGLTEAARLDPRELLDALAEELERSAPPELGIVREYTGEGELLIGDPVRLSEALLQLGRNALGAMPDGGRLTLSSRPIEIFPDEHHGYPAGIGSGKYLEIGVGDTGTGMPAEAIAHAFEPFFTTRPEALGLGLASVYGCVKDHLGAVRIRSEHGKGTLVGLLLPMAGSEDAAEPTSGERGTPGGNERVLLVEEDEILRNLALRALRSLGYRAEGCESGPEALARLAQAPDAHDLILIDRDLSSTDGLGTPRKIIAAAPRARVVMAAGRGPRKLADEFLAAGGAAVVGKPLHLGELAHALRRALG